MRLVLVTAVLALFALAVTLGEQTKPAATFEDYGKWESLISAGSFGGFSPDGRWLTYGINRSNGNNELRLLKLDGGEETVAAFGMRPVFSSDSTLLAPPAFKRRLFILRRHR